VGRRSHTPYFGLMGRPTMPVQNAEIAAMFDQAAELLEIQGENQFRVRAYRRAARVIEGLPQSVRSFLSAGPDLSELPGIDKDFAGKIELQLGKARAPRLAKTIGTARMTNNKRDTNASVGICDWLCEANNA